MDYRRGNLRYSLWSLVNYAFGDDPSVFIPVHTLDYGDRAMAVVESGFCQKDSRAPEMEICGTKGTISFANIGNMYPMDSLEVYLDAPERGIDGW